jgi:hypothetical protein
VVSSQEKKEKERKGQLTIYGSPEAMFPKEEFNGVLPLCILYGMWL